MRVWVRWSAWLCLSLMLWTAAAESTHNHPYAHGIGILLDLRGGAQRQSHCEFQPGRSGLCRGRPAA